MNQSMSSYRSFVCQILWVGVYTVFIFVDFIIISLDYKEDYANDDVRKLDRIFVIIQAILDLTIVLCYVILFVLFLKLINNKDELIFMKRNVLVFFVFMLFVLTVQLLFNMIFYSTYNPGEQIDPVTQ